LLEKIIGKLEACRSLPSSPGIASRILDIAKQPDPSFDELADVIALDPATAVRILQVANSSLYAGRRSAESLRHALLLLGLDASMALALSFSLWKSFAIQNSEQGLDYQLHWRKSLLAGLAAKALAESTGRTDAEELFLGALIQNVGLLALDKAFPELYAGLEPARQLREGELIFHEVAALGLDHAQAGAWLLARWGFPERLVQAVELSHKASQLPSQMATAPFIRIIHLAGCVAEMLLGDTSAVALRQLAGSARDMLGIDESRFEKLLIALSGSIPDAERIFSTPLSSQEELLRICEQAREALAERSLASFQKVRHLEARVQNLEQRSDELEDAIWRDVLTGLHNKAFMEKHLETAFLQASAGREPLSVLFADLDRFKAINDDYGHLVGDEALRKSAALLSRLLDAEALLARFGGEEFVIVTRRTAPAAEALARDIVAAFQNTEQVLNGGRDVVRLTVSIGVATFDGGAGAVFKSSAELLAAADTALYFAKAQGRDRSVCFQPGKADTVR